MNHFSTEHLVEDLKGRTVRGVSVTTVAQVFKFAIQMTSIYVLARLLSPEDFGLVAMVTVITGLLDKFKDGGLSMATIQRPQVTHGQISNLFWINFALGLVLTLLTLIGAPLIAWLYQQPPLLGIASAISTSFIVEAIAIQHSALLTRQMRFKELAFIDVLSMAMGVAIAIVAAWTGWGYWALVVMPLSTSISRTVLVWVITQWIPSWFHRGTGVQSLLDFGLQLTGANLVGYFSSNLTPFMVGLIGGPLQLGLFNRSNTLTAIPATQVLSPITQVLQPALARIASDPARFRRTALSLVRKICLLAMFVTVTMVVTADWIVEIVLGPGWGEAVTYFRLVAVFAIVQPIGNLIAIMLTAQGKPDVLLRWNLIMLVVITISIVIGARWGAMGVVAAYSLSGLLIRFPLLVLWSSPYLHFKASDLAKSVFPITVLALLLFAALVVIRFLWMPASSIAGISIIAPISLLGYLIGCFAMPSIRPELFELFRIGSDFAFSGFASKS